MASLLEDRDESVARRATSYFARWPDPNFSDSLLRAFHTKKGHLLDSCAQALAEMGDDRFVPIFLERYAAKSFKLLDHPGILLAMMELKNPEGIWMIHQLLEKLSETRGDEQEENMDDLVYRCAWHLLRCRQLEEIVFVLRYFLTSSRREEWGYLILAAFVSHANAPYTREHLEEETKPKTFWRLSSIEREQISRLEGAGKKASATVIEGLLKRKSYVELIGFLHREAEEIFERERKIVGESAMGEWEGKERQPMIDLRLLRALAEVAPLVERAEPTVQRRVSITSLLIYTQLVECQGLIGRFPDRTTAEEKMALLLADRMDISEDEEMIHLLSQEKQPPGLVQACLKQIEDAPHSPGAARAVRLLGQLRISEVAPTLLSALYHKDDYLSEAAEDALCEMGEAVLPYIEPVLRDGRDDEIVSILPLLGRLPYQGTVEMILSHFERLHQINREASVSHSQRSKQSPLGIIL